MQTEFLSFDVGTSQILTANAYVLIFGRDLNSV